MPRTTIPTIAAVGPYPVTVAANDLDTTGTAADTVNQNEASFGSSDRLLLTAHNTGASARTITITSTPDPFNRSGNVAAYSLGAGEHMAFMVKRAGWAQSDGKLYFEANNAEVVFRVFAL